MRCTLLSRACMVQTMLSMPVSPLATPYSSSVLQCAELLSVPRASHALFFFWSLCILFTFIWPNFANSLYLCWTPLLEHTVFPLPACSLKSTATAHLIVQAPWRQDPQRSFTFFKPVSLELLRWLVHGRHPINVSWANEWRHNQERGRIKYLQKDTLYHIFSLMGQQSKWIWSTEKDLTL